MTSADQHIRLATYQDELAGHGPLGVAEALRHIAGLGLPALTSQKRYDAGTRTTAISLVRDEGRTLQAAAEVVGATKEAVKIWLDPERAKAKRNRAYARRKEAAEALRDKKRREAAKRIGGPVEEGILLLFAAADKLGHSKQAVSGSREEIRVIDDALDGIYKVRDALIEGFGGW